MKMTPERREEHRQIMTNTEGNVEDKSQGRQGYSSWVHYDNPSTERQMRGRKGSNGDWAVVRGAKQHRKTLYIS